jgi:tRNA dimethylallyltransferase
VWLVPGSSPDIARPEDAQKPALLVLVGPTASGKTEISLHLARMLRGEIVSADSRQVYMYLDIGTAKPSPAFRKAIPHHCVDDLLPDQEFSAGEFGLRGRRIVGEILARGKRPIVVGGSGLYVRSLVDGIFEGPGRNRQLRELLERKAEAGGVGDLLEELRSVDPESAAKADPTKPRRIIRALEVYHSTGEPISLLQKRNQALVGFVPVQFGLEWDRALLYGRIERRCAAMIENGLLREVEALDRRGYRPPLNAFNTVGYSEAFSYRRGEISHAEMLRLFQRNSRRYAKRQLTWFRSDRRVRWIPMSESRTASQVAREIADLFLRSCPPQTGVRRKR